MEMTKIKMLPSHKLLTLVVEVFTTRRIRYSEQFNSLWMTLIDTIVSNSK